MFSFSFTESPVGGGGVGLGLREIKKVCAFCENTWNAGNEGTKSEEKRIKDNIALDHFINRIIGLEISDEEDRSGLRNFLKAVTLCDDCVMEFTRTEEKILRAQVSYLSKMTGAKDFREILSDPWFDVKRLAYAKMKFQEAAICDKFRQLESLKKPQVGTSSSYNSNPSSPAEEMETSSNTENDVEVRTSNVNGIIPESQSIGNMAVTIPLHEEEQPATVSTSITSVTESESPSKTVNVKSESVSKTDNESSVINVQAAYDMSPVVCLKVLKDTTISDVKRRIFNALEEHVDAINASITDENESCQSKLKSVDGDGASDAEIERLMRKSIKNASKHQIALEEISTANVESSTEDNELIEPCNGDSPMDATTEDVNDSTAVQSQRGHTSETVVVTSVYEEQDSETGSTKKSRNGKTPRRKNQGTKRACKADNSGAPNTKKTKGKSCSPAKTTFTTPVPISKRSGSVEKKKAGAASPMDNPSNKAKSPKYEGLILSKAVRQSSAKKNAKSNDGQQDPNWKPKKTFVKVGNRMLPESSSSDSEDDDSDAESVKSVMNVLI